MAEEPKFVVRSTDRGARLTVGKKFDGELHVQGDWQSIDVQGGRVIVGGGSREARQAVGLSLTEPLPALTARCGDLLILFGVGAARYQAECGANRPRGRAGSGRTKLRSA